MNLLYYCHGDDGSLLEALRARLSTHVIYDWSNDASIPQHNISAAIAWMPPEQFFDDLPKLTHVYAVAAGVDHFMKIPGLPNDVDVIRLTDAGMAQQMSEYVLYGTLHAQRRMPDFRVAQNESRWDHHLQVKSAQDTRIGILGAGQLGAAVAHTLTHLHYSVSCWSRTPRNLPTGVGSMHGQASLNKFVSGCDVLVCLLPLTDETTGILNADLFEHLPAGAFLINPGRGPHLIDDDLLGALDNGTLSGALLDVFHDEPLPENHRFWRHPRIVITPHVAAKSLVNESADQIADSINCIESGGTPAGLVDRQRGY